MHADGAQLVVQLKRGSGSAGPQRIALLAAIRAEGSIAAAARAAGLSYKGAWDAVQALNNMFERPLVEAQPGGRAGGAATVTAAGEAVIAAYGEIDAALAELVDRLSLALESGTDARNLLWRLNLNTSARNAYRGHVRAVIEGAVNSQVSLDIGGGIELIATVTKATVSALGLASGREAVALFKSSFVILVPGATPIQTSARNCLAGTIVGHDTGAVNDEITLDLGSGKTVTAIVTRESAEALGFAVGTRALALVKASHVILAVD